MLSTGFLNQFVEKSFRAFKGLLGNHEGILANPVSD
jgi:hypothetical protein